MAVSFFNPRFFILFLIILIAAMLRIPATLIPALSNFTPIGAMALFGGHYFSSKTKSFIFPLLTLLMSDLIINNLIYEGKYGVMHDSWYWIYGTFCLIVLIGKYALKKITITNIVLAAILSTLLYWFIADGMVWLGGGKDLRTTLPLGRNFSGLIQSYVQGLPFMKNFLSGTLLYSAIMFGAFEWLQQHVPALKTSNE